jgi:hypothetical protein
MPAKGPATAPKGSGEILLLGRRDPPLPLQTLFGASKG